MTSLKQDTTGHSISEYVLLFGIVTVVSITALSSLGTDISNLISPDTEVKSEISKLYSLLDTSDRGEEPSSPLLNDILISDQVSSQNSLDILMSQGSVTTSGQGFTDLADRLNNEGIGALSEALANDLDLIILSQNLNPEQQRVLRDLANQAHDIAAIQRTIEAAANTATAPSEFAYAPVKYKGQDYTVAELAGFLDFYGDGTPFETHSPVTAPGAGDSLNQFQTTYKQAQSVGALDNPQINDIVTNHANQIGYLAESVGHKVWQYATDNTLKPDSYNNSLASDATDIHATGICTTGKQKDTGEKCS